MKRITKKQRDRDILNALDHRTPSKTVTTTPFIPISRDIYSPINDFIEKEMKNGLNYTLTKSRQKGIIVYLPKHMDFNQNHDVTLQHLTVISKLVELIKKNKGRVLPRGSYNLGSVNFDNLESISTPAALVLTAEISNWDDTLRNKLTPKVKRWNDDIYSQLSDLGFFDLFKNKPCIKPCSNEHPCSDKRLVRYKKGECGVKGKTKELKTDLMTIIGDSVNKWTFLHTGLGEAITNVSHHAYPDDYDARSSKKQWFLTGSYNEQTKQLKVAFYDQGIGIPNTLPGSKVKEKVLEYLSKLNIDHIERKKDEQLLKAAVEINRTSTGINDRGKGLQDLLEFIKQLKSGRLSILSGSGHYTYTMKNGNESSMTTALKRPILGTLIIWSVNL
ncbi:hypothetical protein [Photobacterium phosphoreum]|uniref:hypothetical protein n=1 Tax=Photobacterium phosphoreum TaxID=659 RepID=UPI0039AFCA7D